MYEIDKQMEYGNDLTIVLIQTSLIQLNFLFMYNKIVEQN